MQLKRPSTTAKVLASSLKKVTRARSKPEKLLLFLFAAFFLLVIISITKGIDGGQRSSSTESATDAGKKRGNVKRALNGKEDGDDSNDNNNNNKDAGDDTADTVKRGDVTPPKLELFLQRVRNALGPYMKRYVDRVPVASLASDAETCGITWSSMKDGWALAAGTCRHGPCPTFDTLKAAKAKCISMEDDCGGITQLADGSFVVKPFEGSKGMIRSSKGERSWKKIPNYCETKNMPAKSTAQRVWDAFHDVVDAALEEDDLKLMSELYKTKEDGSFFISIAAYRDRTCRDTLRKAYERAKYPSKVSVGIVQQNCVHPTKCMTGTGWANTRAWVPSPGPDPDCAEEFCKSELGKPHCEAGRVRILRLDEIDALGPFFTRFVNAKLWRGENYYLQIDAHTDFRSAWDESLAAQMRATKSYPNSVISNYPPGGTPSDTTPWKELAHPTTPDARDGIPAALCGCSFENAGGEHVTVRLAQTGRHFEKELGRPRRSLFVAAGFFIAHGNIVNQVGFDPFLPFLFMGEEIALSIRFYTSGFDIYAPSADVLRHEYVRKESPKFWESVGHVYSAGNIHNELTDLIVQRVQNLVKFPEADSEDKINPQTLLTRLSQFGLGTKRSADQFVKVSGMDLLAKSQRAPKWCSDGNEPVETPRIILDKLDRDLLQ